MIFIFINIFSLFSNVTNISLASSFSITTGPILVLLQGVVCLSIVYFSTTILSFESPSPMAENSIYRELQSSVGHKIILYRPAF